MGTTFINSLTVTILAITIAAFAAYAFAIVVGLIVIPHRWRFPLPDLRPPGAEIIHAGHRPTGGVPVPMDLTIRAE